MSASHSQSKAKTTTSNTTIADSYNQTLNRVVNASESFNSNVSDSGNVGLGLGADGESIAAIMPYMLGIFGILGAVMILRKGGG